MSITLDTEALQTISLVEKVTGARIDKFFPREDRIVFVVESGGAKRIVGPDGKMLKNLELKLGKRIKVIEKTPEKFRFIQNAMLPLKIESIREEEGIVYVQGKDEKTRGLMIGAKARNLRFTESIVQMYFPDVKEIKVIA